MWRHHYGDGVRIGLLGAARIAPAALIAPARDLAGIEVASVAARDRVRAEAFAAEHNIAHVHESYESMINDDSLDAVYIALPNSAHGRWSIAALEAGRHVLVEKPFAVNQNEAEEMVGVAEKTGRLLVEAFHWRYHPIAQRMLEIRAELGQLISAEAEFSTDIPAGDIRYDVALAGGAMMDLGCYPVHWLRVLAGEEPAIVDAVVDEGPPGIDETMVANLVFPCGLVARLRTSMEDAEEFTAFLDLEGEDGWLQAKNPLLPHLGNRVRAELPGERVIDEEIEGLTTYHYQLDAFRHMVEDGLAPLTGGADAIANMAVIDAIYESAGLAVRAVN